MPKSHTHPDPEQLSRPTGSESVTRNAHGQSLDDARETFRAEWQAKIRMKRQEAVRARRCHQWSRVAGWTLFFGGIGAGSLLGAMALAYPLAAESIPLFVVLIVSGAILATYFVLSASICAWYWKKRAAQLEREVREMEQN